MYANVFPLPVFATEIRSCPLRQIGIAKNEVKKIKRITVFLYWSRHAKTHLSNSVFDEIWQKWAVKINQG